MTARARRTLRGWTSRRAPLAGRWVPPWGSARWPELSAGGAWTALLLVLYAFLVLRDAWVSDDAYITLRAVDQLLAGNGPVHNADERVQGFTHPLWMILMSATCALTGELYFAPLLLGVVCSLLAAWVLGFRLAPRAPFAPVAVGTLAVSRSFVDYSTSGLENPLTFLLVGWFLTRYFSAEPAGEQGLARLRGEALLASLLALNRLDAVLLVAPALGQSALSVGRRLPGGSAGERVRRVASVLVVGFLPLLAWELFSLVYYGSFVPNTALAKLGTGIPRTESIAQGFVYLRESFAADYPLALLLMASPLLLFAIADGRSLAALLGAWLSLAYVVLVGGDFMAGRFLTPSAFALLAVATHLSVRWSLALDRALVSLALLAGVTPGGPVGLLPARPQLLEENGVADERRYYEGNTGLLSWARGRALPDSPWRGAGEAQAANSAVRLDAVGIHSSFSSRDARVVDEWALVDPLLARLPAVYAPTWRIGHFRRAVPEGYLELRDAGKGGLRDRRLGKLHAHLRRIVSGPIWSAERWRSIWLMNTGQLRKYVAFDHYRYAGSPEVPLEKLGKAGRRANVRVAGTGIRVKFETAGAWFVGIGLRRGAEYRVLLLTRGKVVHEFDVEAPRGDFRAPERLLFEVPEEAREADTLRVVTRGSHDGRIDHLILGPDAASVRGRLAGWAERVGRLEKRARRKGR